MNQINLSIGSRPELEWVAVDQILVDSNYQREIKPRLVDRILRNFSWAKFGAVVLSKQEDGRFTIVEGQHRWKAATMHPAIDAIPAVVVQHKDIADEAESFLAINRDRMAVSSVEQYWAGLTSGDERAIAISTVLQSAGCDVVPAAGHYRPNLTNSISAIDRCLKRYGHGPTRRALLVIRAAWPNDARSLRGTLITALARIIHANDKTISEPDLVTALSKALVEIYNKGKRVNTIMIGVQA